MKREKMKKEGARELLILWVLLTILLLNTFFTCRKYKSNNCPICNDINEHKLIRCNKGK